MLSAGPFSTGEIAQLAAQARISATAGQVCHFQGRPESLTRQLAGKMCLFRAKLSHCCSITRLLGGFAVCGSGYVTVHRELVKGG